MKTAKGKGKKLPPKPAKSKKRKTPKPAPPKPARKPRQTRLPGMEDSPIKDLEEAAIEHSEIRSEIVATRARLKESEITITSLMKSNGKTSYNHNGIRLKLREGHDAVSVQVKRHDREDAPEPEEVEPEHEPTGDEDETETL